MKHTLYLLIAVLTSILSVSCSEERLAGSVSSSEFEEGELVLASLHLSVNGFEVNVQSGSRAPEDEPTQEELAGTNEENAIHNIWVFQFDTNGDQLINPRYYEIADQAELQDLKVWLKPGMASTVYVVANTGQPNWIKENTDVSTLTKLESLDLFNLEPQFTNEGQTLSLPMEGKEDNVTVSEVSGAPEKNSVTVHVTRMFAKLQVKVSIERENMQLRGLLIGRMPKACRVSARTGNEGDRTDYESGMDNWRTTDFDLSDDTDYTYIVYTAENMQGKIEDGSNIKDQNNAPSNALWLMARIGLTDSESGTSLIPYFVYPGANERDDFNVKRNCIYDVNINISENANVSAPSSNCFIVAPGNLLSFEPYYRVEKGGGYDIKGYLDLDDETGKKVIDHVKILWQTKDAIGDNENEMLVWYNETQKKIYVQTNQEGNALIAAYNKEDKIIWSWHIWITGIKPDYTNIRYKTYVWDENQIYGKDSERERTTGYDVMTCNLGALANVPEDDEDTKPYGMLYQWGRKDPFPPFKKNQPTQCLYTSSNMGYELYDNSNQIIVNDIEGNKDNYVFTSLSGTEIQALEENPIDYAIQNPTVFMCGTNEYKIYSEGASGIDNINNYFAEGDWTDHHDDKLWGGLSPEEGYENKKKYTISEEKNVHIYNNYGPLKTIFDPCPYGWRVPPGDLWLGFTSTGLNPKVDSEINYYQKQSKGMYIYMENWKSGIYSYFPNQGTRVGNGYGIRVSQCGNYHNATTDSDNRVNILHIHNQVGLFHIFEYDFLMYYVKSVAGPIRCIRDPNPQQ